VGGIVPSAAKWQAVELLNLSIRADEEICRIREDMTTAVDHFTALHGALIEVASESSPAVCAVLLHHALITEAFLCDMRVITQKYICSLSAIPQSSSSIHFNQADQTDFTDDVDWDSGDDSAVDEDFGHDDV
jgi:hypothetical protein